MGYIYKITNTINGKIYIGKTLEPNPYERFRERISESRKERSWDIPLYRAMRKYGEHSFIFEILEEVDDDTLNDKEIYYIKEYNSYYNGYNLSGDGNERISKEAVSELYLELFCAKLVADKLGVDGKSVSNILENLEIPRYDVRPDAKPIAIIDNKHEIIIFSSLTYLSCRIYTERTGSTEYYTTNITDKVILVPDIAGISSHIGRSLKTGGTAYGHKYKRVSREDFCKLIRLWINKDPRVTVYKTDRTITIYYRPKTNKGEE